MSARLDSRPLAPARRIWRRAVDAVVAAALGAVAACGGSDRVTAPSAATPLDPSFAIADARDQSGRPGFYWLPPILPALAEYPRAFDATRTPVVEVCVWGGSACVGNPVARFTIGDGSLTVDAVGQAYRANWTVRSLAPGLLHRIRVLDEGVEQGYADAKVPGQNETAPGLIAQRIVPLGNGSRLPIRFRLEVPPPNTAPTVTITAPPEGTSVPVGTPVTLTGTASDPEDGDLSSQIVWRSSQVTDPLGTGATLPVTLPIGRNRITASVTDAGGQTTTSAPRDIVVSIVSAPVTLNVPYGQTASLPVTLSADAPAGGLTFTVTSADPAKVAVETQTITIPGGGRSANATLRGAAPGNAEITVSNPDYGAARTQARVTANLNVVQSSLNFPAGRSETVTIELESNNADIAAPAGGLQVALTSANAACAGAATPVTIPAGLVSITTTVTHGGTTTLPCTTTITANAVGLPEVVTDAFTVAVQPAPTITLGNGARVGAGLRTAISFSLGAPAPAGGVAVTVTSSNGTVLRVQPTTGTGCSATTAPPGEASASVTIPAGQSGGCVMLDGIEGQSGTVTLTASAEGYTNGTASATVAPITLQLLGVPGTTTVLSPNTVIWARVGPVSAANTGLNEEQIVRPGGTALELTFTNSQASVAQLVTSAGAGQTRTATIAVGQSRTNTSNAANGAVEFDPIGGGTTTVTVATPGAVSTPQAAQTSTVTGVVTSTAGRSATPRTARP